MVSTSAKTNNTSFFTVQFFMLCTSNFLFSASFTMMIPELPAYLTHLGGAEYKGLIISLFTLMAGISRPFSGKLTDTVGRVPVMIFGSLVCVICSFSYTLLTSVAAFLFLRFLHGFSTGFKPTATSAYGSDVVHESRRAEALGAIAMGYTIGQSIGPVIGSYLVDHYSYNAMFYASSALAMGSVIILYNIKETLPQPQKFKRKLLYIKRNELFEASALKPAIVLLLLSFASGCSLTLAPDLSESVGLHNKGIFFGVYTIAALLIRLIAGKAADRYGRIPVLIVSAAGLALAMFILSITHSVFMLLAGSAIFGLSWGMNGPTITAWTVDLAAPEKRGRAVASMYIALEAGIGIGAIVCADIYANNTANFVYAFAMPVVLALVSLILLFVWRKQTPKRLVALDVMSEEI